VEDVVISPDGSDIFFDTTQGLVPQDTDGAPDVYDARVDGGFPPEPGPIQPCSGDACQGPLTNPAPLLIPGSVVQVAGGNLAQPGAASSKVKKTHKSAKNVGKNKHKKKTHSKVRKKRSARTTAAKRGSR
jgi:hypothetical protein